MTRKEFNQLKHGDVILWRSGKRACLRTVIVGPADDGHEHITLAIRRRSWTGRARTGYGWNDVKRIVRRLVKRTRKMILASERDHLEEIGFNPRKEMIRELREEKARKLRMGAALCKRRFVLP